MIQHSTNNSQLVELNRLIMQKINSIKKESVEMKFKAILLPIIYIALYLIAMNNAHNNWIFYSCYAGLGLMIVFFFLNLIHEAVHGHLFKKKQWNDNYFIVFDLLGANSYIWKKRHLLMHHPNSNISGLDGDVGQSKLLQMYPFEKRNWLTKYQHIYCFFIYPLYIINWLLFRDFNDFFNSKSLIRKEVKTIPFKEYEKLFIYKFIFIFYMIFIPILFFKISTAKVIIGFLLTSVAGSIFALAALLTSHVNTGNTFFENPEKKPFELTWLEHQLNSTNDLKVYNFFTRYCMGNFNYHTIHHVLPHVPYIYAHEATQILEQYAQKHNLPYKKISFWQALKMHYQLLKNNKLEEKFFEMDM